MNSYLFSILVLMSLAGIVALALNLQWGLSGMVNFGLFGFYMLGAYLCAILVYYGSNPWSAMLAAIIGTALASALVSLISIRLADDYLAIVTLGFAECMKLLIIHEDWATRGSLGIADIARPVHSEAAFLVLTLLALALVFVLLELISRAPFGRVARALRDDPLVAATLGKNVLAFRVKLFAAGGAAIGLAGALHAFYYQYIDPTQFGPIITAYAFMAVIIGGRGSNRGVLLSTFTVVLLLESTRFLNDYISWLSAAQLASLRLILIGLVLILILIFRPQGWIREYRFKSPSQQPPQQNL
ncbi:branched-chain amino acid transport system permease protein [Herbaspirillum sp. Sphag1AN]|uniref:branched-chain amino acid ABC transporter permease n=1 Tax=unclassified Herbaspirillum TaxID=2624150 RepID=UPI00160F8D8F|nr:MULTISPECIES: branched-chain amino acid ABC transporter permease [unclassified Herbaspirillum]MBB3211843.1 branched-chain amino acid transport system permease protein [Herbaspirillum sp. Sphag1AN]MBB3244323.1 branched-chain amino acid transport system permease protein [Herbaspirillum sp. Sphag64]